MFRNRIIIIISATVVCFGLFDFCTIRHAPIRTCVSLSSSYKISPSSQARYAFHGIFFFVTMGGASVCLSPLIFYDGAVSWRSPRGWECTSLLRSPGSRQGQRWDCKHSAVDAQLLHHHHHCAVKRPWGRYQFSPLPGLAFLVMTLRVAKDLETLSNLCIFFGRFLGLEQKWKFH